MLTRRGYADNPSDASTANATAACSFAGVAMRERKIDRQRRGLGTVRTAAKISASTARQKCCRQFGMAMRQDFGR
jgi:glutamate/tyrosine decarboxylase-like PLP-dependent enzyme